MLAFFEKDRTYKEGKEGWFLAYGIDTGTFMMEHFIEERKKITFIPELSLVAVLEDGTIVGEVALHEKDIVTENGRNKQLVLAQSAVLVPYRMQVSIRIANHLIDFVKK